MSDESAAEREQRRERVAELANDPAHTEAGADFPDPKKRRFRGGPREEPQEIAIRSIDDAYERGEIDEPTGTRLIDVSDRDPLGTEARYIAAVADPAYARAFAKKVTGMGGAAEELTSEEQQAVLAVGRVMSERALGEAEGKTGQFALPIAIDPSIALTSEGAVSALRQLASVQTISTFEWRGVTSAGVTAAFTAEATEATDASPELAQPTIKPAKAQAFVPFSIEVGEDWASMQAELSNLLRDAKAVLEATKFLTGTGTNEPFGILTGATEEVTTATEKKVETKDIYSLQAALPARFQPNATFQSNLASANSIYKLVGGGSTEPKLFNDERTKLLMKPWYENSVMDTIVETSGKKPVLYGDINAGFKIIDRIGMNIELIPFIFGKENARPTGQRGLYAYWRVGSKVTNKAALRTLKIK
jgi:HK97 family phage major capsid protein